MTNEPKSAAVELLEGHLEELKSKHSELLREIARIRELEAASAGALAGIAEVERMLEAAYNVSLPVTQNGSRRAGTGAHRKPRGTFKCRYCELIYDTARGRTQHENGSHGELHTCYVCELDYHGNSAWHNHLAKTHRIDWRAGIPERYTRPQPTRLLPPDPELDAARRLLASSLETQP